MENIDEINNAVVEDTTGAAADNIATTDQHLTRGEMYQQLALPSLGRQIFSTTGMQGPTAALFNVQRKSGTNDFELLRNNVAIYPSEMIKSGMSQEVAQDIEAQFGRAGTKLIATVLRGAANEDENAKTLEFLNKKSVSQPTLNLSDSLNSFTTFNEINQAVQAQVVSMNTKNTRTYESWCVLPATVAASIAARVNSGRDEFQKATGLFIGKYGMTKFYINPDAADTKAYVGLKDEAEMSKSSAIFSTFQEELVETNDPDTGEIVIWIVNRFAITASPLHQLNNEMFRMFQIVI